MPHRHAVAGVSVLVLITLVLATLANITAITNAYQVRKQCNRIQTHSNRTRANINETLIPLKRGDYDDDYRRIFPDNFKERKQEQIDRLQRQLGQFEPITCTPLVIRWMKGAIGE